MTWLQTASGKCFDLLNPTAGMVDINDISHHLSQINRFTGATREPYSVAQHSVHVAEVLPEELKIYGLLHDANETYTSDISTPMKEAIRSSYSGGDPFVAGGMDGVMWSIDTAIAESLLGYATEAFRFHRREVKEADLRMLLTEKRDLMFPCDREWEWVKGLEPYDFTITPWPARKAEGKFLEMFHKLTTKEEIAV